MVDAVVICASARPVGGRTQNALFDPLAGKFRRGFTGVAQGDDDETVAGKIYGLRGAQFTRRTQAR